MTPVRLGRGGMPSGLCVAALTTVSSAPNLVGIQVLPVALGGVSIGEREGKGLRWVGLVMSWVRSCTDLRLRL